MKFNLVEDFSLSRALILGTLLGVTTFWNGSMLIGALLLLGGVFFISSKKVELIIIAILSLTICFFMTYFFVGDRASVKPELWLGLLAYPKNAKTIFSYYVRLFGIMPLLYFFSIVIAQKKLKVLLTLFCIPMIFANTIKITPDINANHKFMIVAQIGTALGCALVTYSFWRLKKLFFKTTAVILFCGCSRVITQGNNTITIINSVMQRDRKSTRLNSSHLKLSRMPSSA